MKNFKEDPYISGFGGVNEVFEEFEEFGHTKWYRDTNSKPESTDHINILFAVYTCESYSGDAHVVYQSGDKLYYVYGAHCSCYGLEGQWSPAEVSPAELAGYNYGYGWNKEDKKAWNEFLNYLGVQSILEVQ